MENFHCINSRAQIEKAKIGDGVWLEDAVVEDNVILADGVKILRAAVGRDTYIGRNATVEANVGEGCTVAEGAIVRRPLSAGAHIARYSLVV